MKKIAIIQKTSPAAWKSCQSIKANLLSSYESLENCEIKIFSSSESPSNFSFVQLSEEVFSFSPDLICFADYHPHPATLIGLFAQKKWSRWPRLMIHVYGDFVINSSCWFQIENDLKKFSISWICASAKQSGLIKKFLAGGGASIPVIPFPVDNQEFFYSAEQRNIWRDQFKISPDEFCWLYTGRLSSQKNIDSLIDSFIQYRKNFSPKARLFVAGPIDDLGTPYLGRNFPAGLMSYHYSQILGKAQNLTYLGQVGAKELNLACNGSDAFISLSTHNDEDFGMSPAEGLMTGLPAVLSHWGGYAGFISYFPQMTKAIPILMESKKLTVDPRHAAKTMLAMELESSNLERQKNSEVANAQLGVGATSRRLKNLIESEAHGKFMGWTKLFQQVASTLKIHPAAPFKRGQQYSELYREVYGEYGN